MFLQNRNPFNGLWLLDESFSRDSLGLEGQRAMPPWALPVDVLQDDDNVIIHASLPGFKPQDIRATIEENVLTIDAETKPDEDKQNGNYLLRERRMGHFSRTLRLPDTFNGEKAETHYHQGVLSITLPRSEDRKARQLEIKVA